MGISDSQGAENIASLRKQIDAVDDEIIACLLKRIELSNIIMKSKPPTQILDSDREAMIVKRYSEKLSDVSTGAKLKQLVLGILGASRFYPELRAMDVECLRIKIKPGTLPQVRQWAARLNSDKAELTKLVENEGLLIESVFLEQSAEGDFLIYYLRSPNLKRAKEIAKASTHPIDVFHRDVMKQIVDGHQTLECLLDASAPRP